MNFTCIFFGIMFIAGGMWFAFCKGFQHISAWKEMSEDEKKKINIIPLCRNVGCMISLSGIIFLLKGIWNIKWFIWAMIAWLIIAGLDVWYISRCKQYVRK